MIERLPSGRDYIDDNGNIRNIADLRTEDVDEIASHYDNLPVEDREQFDRILLGVEHAGSPKSPIVSEMASQRPYEDVRALASAALFFFDKDMRAESVRSSIEQHPSTYGRSVEEVRSVADVIIQAYTEEVEKLSRYKKGIDLSEAKRSVFIAVMRNDTQLNDEDRARIATALGYDEDHFQHESETEHVRDRDWRERQYKDD